MGDNFLNIKIKSIELEKKPQKCQSLINSKRSYMRIIRALKAFIVKKRSSNKQVDH